MATFRLTSSYPVRGVRLINRPGTEPVREYSENMLARILEMENRKSREELTALLEQEKKSARDEGFAAGIAECEQRYLKEFGKTFAVLRKIADTFHHEVDTLLEREEQELLKLVIAIARKVVDAEVQLNPDAVLGVLKNALNLLNDRRSIRIHVHPQDWTVVKNSLDGLNLKVELPRDVEVVSSPHVSPGGCLVDSSSGSIDADLDTQFEEIRRKLLKDESNLS